MDRSIDKLFKTEKKTDRYCKRQIDNENVKRYCQRCGDSSRDRETKRHCERQLDTEKVKKA